MYNTEISFQNDDVVENQDLTKMGGVEVKLSVGPTMLRDRADQTPSPAPPLTTSTVTLSKRFKTRLRLQTFPLLIEFL